MLEYQLKRLDYQLNTRMDNESFYLALNIEKESIYNLIWDSNIKKEAKLWFLLTIKYNKGTPKVFGGFWSNRVTVLANKYYKEDVANG